MEQEVCQQFHNHIYLHVLAKKKKTKLLTLIIAYFAAEGIWNNNIIIAFVNKKKSSTMECRDIEEQFVTECDPHNLNQFSQ